MSETTPANPGVSVETRILFNGRQYTSVDAMPPEAREAYEKLLAQFEDADHNGIPDILERGAAGNVVAIQKSSFTVNGRPFGSLGEMPEPLRRLCEEAMALAGAGGAGLLEPKPSAPDARQALRANLTVTGPLESALGGFLRILLGLVAIAVVAGAAFLMAVMDEGSRSQGGRLYVVIGALLALGAVDSAVARLLQRRLAAAADEAEAHRRYRVLSFLLLALAALVLAGLALLLP